MLIRTCTIHFPIDDHGVGLNFNENYIDGGGTGGGHGSLRLAYDTYELSGDGWGDGGTGAHGWEIHSDTHDFEAIG